jgi:hypothetical protein
VAQLELIKAVQTFLDIGPQREASHEASRQLQSCSRNDRNHHPRWAKRIEEVQRELREIYVLAKD